MADVAVGVGFIQLVRGNVGASLDPLVHSSDLIETNCSGSQVEETNN